MKKKLGFFLAIIFGLFFFLGTNVHAEDVIEDGFYLGGEKYETLEAANAAVNSYEKKTYITRYGDYEQTADISLGKGMTLDVVEGTFTWSGKLTNSAVNKFTSTGSGSFVWNNTCESTMNNRPLTIIGGTHYSFNNVVSTATYYSLTGGTFLGITSANKTNMEKKVSTGYALEAEQTGDTYTLNVITLAEKVSSSTRTLSSLKVTYSQGEGYWKRVTSLSSLTEGQKVLIGYAYGESLVLMMSSTNASYKNMYCGANFKMTVNGSQQKEASLKDVEVLSSNSFRIGDDLKNYAFDFHKESTSGYFSWESNGTEYPLVNLTEGSSDRYLCANYSMEVAKNNGYTYLVKVDNVGVWYGKKLIAFGNKVSSQGTQGRAFISSSTEVYEDSFGDLNNKPMFVFAYNEGDYQASNVSLRFGGVVDYSSKVKIDKLGTVTYGVIAAGINRIVGDLTIENATYIQEITPVCVANIGDSEENTLTGEYYQFALVIDDIPKNYYDYEIMARAYICVDGTYYYYQPARYSVKTIAQAYLDALDTSAYTEHLDVLAYLAA